MRWETFSFPAGVRVFTIIHPSLYAVRKVVLVKYVSEWSFHHWLLMPAAGLFHQQVGIFSSYVWPVTSSLHHRTSTLTAAVDPTPTTTTTTPPHTHHPHHPRSGLPPLAVDACSRIVPSTSRDIFELCLARHFLTTSSHFHTHRCHSVITDGANERQSLGWFYSETDTLNQSTSSAGLPGCRHFTVHQLLSRLITLLTRCRVITDEANERQSLGWFYSETDTLNQSTSSAGLPGCLHFTMHHRVITDVANERQSLGWFSSETDTLNQSTSSAGLPGCLHFTMHHRVITDVANERQSLGWFSSETDTLNQSTSSAGLPGCLHFTTELLTDGANEPQSLGWFYSETDTLNQITSSAGLPGCRHFTVHLLLSNRVITDVANERQSLGWFSSETDTLNQSTSSAGLPGCVHFTTELLTDGANERQSLGRFYSETDTLNQSTSSAGLPGCRHFTEHHLLSC
ncbi:hypothetical protein J6590_010736 [Homalodisca vitripennis]|nr:hypothetical protein J6590_010736 [Homalodisca vitripennis]